MIDPNSFYRTVNDEFPTAFVRMFWTCPANRSALSRVRFALASRGISPVKVLLLPWTFPWMLAAYAARILFAGCIFMAVGRDMARQAWRDTR